MSESGARVPRVLAIDAGGTMTDTFIVDERGLVRRRQGADDSRGRVDRLHGLGARRAGPVGLDARGRLPGDRLGHLLRNGDAQPAAPAPGAEDRLHRQRRPRGLPAAGARHPDAPRLLLLRPPPPRDPLPQRAARPARADEGRARPHRRVRGRGPPAARAGRDRGGDRAARRGRGRHRRLAAVLLPQPRPRAPRAGDRRGREGRARHRRRGPGLPLLASSTRCAATCRD